MSMPTDLSFMHRRRFGLLAVGAASFLATTARAQAAPMTVTHRQGSLRLDVAPRSVLVFDIASLDTLQALGVAVKGVPAGRKPPYLAAYDTPSYLRIGSMFEPDMEAVHSARPDLIIVGGRSSAKYAELARIAPTIDLTVEPKDFLASVYGNVQTLGRVFGREAAAEQLLQQVRADIEALKPKAAAAGKGLIVLTTGGRMSAYGPGSRFGVLHDGFGIVAAQPQLDVSNHGQAVSFEFLLQTNPDWLFVVDRDAAIGREGVAARQYLDNELVRKTTAWSRQQVVYLNAANWYTVGGAGITALRENVAQLATAFGARGG